MDVTVEKTVAVRGGSATARVVGLCLLVIVLDGFDMLVIALTAPAIAADWGLSAQRLGPLFAAGILGMIGGSVLIAPLGDRLGRVRVLMLCCGLFGLFAGLTALAGGYWSLLGLRLLTGLGLGGAVPNATALISEHASPRRRPLLVSVGLVGFSVGGMLCAGLAVPLLPRFGWRALYLVGGVLPLLLIPVLWRFLPEAPAAARELAPGRSGGVRRLLAADLGPDTRRLWLGFFINMMVMFFLANWVPYLAGQAGFSAHQGSLAALALNLGGMVGPLLLAALCQRLDARRVIGTAFVLAAASLVAVGYATGSFGVYLAAAALAGFFVFGAQIALHALAAAAYPTALRATGIGWALGCGRVGSVFGPLLGGELLRSGVPLQYYFSGFGLVVLLAAAATFTLSARAASAD
ncbi:MFS transporter [Immundisolibacter sp.]|uniref:MFS transporter n=1 Tax=Immundisolibacter sp. TaxID=1934948 RepID=UPI002B076534|nr:MFS transporter [Immundisolibacter sp.]MEA3220212.1 3-hydroxybenzoate transporter MhbT [Immundisolibacter sp.]